jgi:protein O-mannosyl-transferase
MPKRKKSANNQSSRDRPVGIHSPNQRLYVVLGAVVIAVAVFLAYLPSINGGFIFDDDKLLTNNVHIRSSDGLYKFWCTTEELDYWPVTYTTLWIEWRLWGMSPTGYHVTNLVLHIIESLLIWLILRKLSIPGAFLAAMLFAVHPVNVESVAWISQRKNMMAMLFFLLSIWWYLESEGITPGTSSGAKHLLSTIHYPLTTSLSFSCWYCLSLAAFALAMLSKGSVAVLPVLLLGIVWWLRPLTRWDLLKIAAFFLVSGVLTVVNLWFQTHGAETVMRTAGFTERLLGAGGVVWFYLYKSLLPVELAFVYPQWQIDAGIFVWWLPLSAAVVVTAVFWRYRQSWSRPFLFAWGFFCTALAPVLGFTDVGFMRYSLVADHYQHIALIAVAVLVAVGWNVWHQWSPSISRLSATFVAVAAVGILAFLTWRQSGIYSDGLTLYRATLEKNPDCWMAHNNLALALVDAVQPGEAIKHFQQAIILKPDYVDALNNYGGVLLKLSRPGEAIGYFQRVLQLKPEHAEALNNLGVSLEKTGRPQEAIFYYEKALRLRSDYLMAQANLGNLYFNLGKLQEAIDQYKKALAIKEDNPRIHNSLGNVYQAASQYQQAMEHYSRALQLKPDFPEAHNNLGGIMANDGRFQEAIGHFKMALQYRPDYVTACNNLALAYASLGQSSEAIATARKALDLARSQGQTAQVRQIEDWLKKYQGAEDSGQGAGNSDKKQGQ